MKLNHYLILISILFLSACAGTQTTVTETKKKVETVTEIVTKKIDTTVFVPAESNSLFIPIKETTVKKGEAPKVFTQKSGRVRTTVTIDSLGIKATSNCDSLALKINYYEQTLKQLKKENSELKSTTIQKKGYTLTELILYIIAALSVGFVAAILLKTFKII